MTMDIVDKLRQEAKTAKEFGFPEEKLLDHAANEITRLRAELAELIPRLSLTEHDASSLRIKYANSQMALAAKTQECEELRKDAERWRKQRQLGIPSQEESGYWIVRIGQAADYAIDAAIKEDKHE